VYGAYNIVMINCSCTPKRIGLAECILPVCFVRFNNNICKLNNKYDVLLLSSSLSCLSRVYNIYVYTTCILYAQSSVNKVIRVTGDKWTSVFDPLGFRLAVGVQTHSGGYIVRRARESAARAAPYMYILYYIMFAAEPLVCIEFSGDFFFVLFCTTAGFLYTYITYVRAPPFVIIFDFSIFSTSLKRAPRSFAGERDSNRLQSAISLTPRIRFMRSH